jgi:hypothetical protein
MSSLRRTLVDRILQAKGKTRLQKLLKDRKEKSDGRAKFATTGEPDALNKSVDDAITGGFLMEADLAQLADELEEIGGQHVFLFRLTDKGKGELTFDYLRASFNEHQPSLAYYDELPATADVEWLERDGKVYLKQVHTATYWELDRKKSVWTDEVRHRIWEKIRRRAVNLLLLDPVNATVEICIDRLRGEDDEKLAERELSEFLKAIEPAIRQEDHFEPVRVRHCLGTIVAETLDETFLNSDGVYDEEVSHRMSNRRKGTRGQDIRKNPGYSLADADYDRDGLKIYWFTGPMPAPTDAETNDDDDSDDEERGGGKAEPVRPSVFTVISGLIRVVDKKKFEHGKVYISAKISAKDRAHVIGRIRHFAR